MQTIKDYKETSGQMINSDKSRFLVHQNFFWNTNDRIKRITGFNIGSYHLTLMPFFVGTPRISYFSDLVNKVICGITRCHTKQLSYGGRVVLIKHVLQALPINLLSDITTPSTVLEQIQMLMAYFFRGWKSDNKKYHWASLKNFRYSTDKKGWEWGIWMISVCQRSNPICKKMGFWWFLDLEAYAT